MISQWEVIGRLLTAAVLGSLIGVERERLAWAAGLRTHMLVAVGSCLIMVVSAFGFRDVLGTPAIVLDPSRIAAQVVSGIGFIGAGCILLRGEIVRGLTTAASLWTVAAIGLAVGGGLYLPAAAATLIILAILLGLKPLEEWLQHRNKSHELLIKAERHTLSIDALNEALGYRAKRITRFICSPAEDDQLDEVHVSISRLPASDLSEVVRLVRELPQVRSIELPQEELPQKNARSTL